MSLLNKPNGATMRRKLAALVAAGAGVTALVLPASAARAASTCSSATCITVNNVVNKGISLDFDVDTAVPTTLSVTLYQNGNAIPSTTTKDGISRQHHDLSPWNVQPNSAYAWLLTATDSTGHSATKTGNVTTLHRQVDVLFTTYTIIDDSDNDSAGELKAWNRVGSASRVDALLPESIESGSTVYAPDMFRIRDGAATLSIFTEIIDNDSWNPALPFVQLPFPSNATWDYGSTAMFDWNTASASLATYYPTNGWRDGQWMEENSHAPSVRFRVHYQYSVSYVA